MESAFFCAIQKISAANFFRIFFTEFTNKKFSGIFFGDFFIFFPPFAARRRLKCKIFTVSRARVVKNSMGANFMKTNFSGRGLAGFSVAKMPKIFF